MFVLLLLQFLRTLDNVMEMNSNGRCCVK